MTYPQALATRTAYPRPPAPCRSQWMAAADGGGISRGQAPRGVSGCCPRQRTHGAIGEAHYEREVVHAVVAAIGSRLEGARSPVPELLRHQSRSRPSAPGRPRRLDRCRSAAVANPTSPQSRRSPLAYSTPTSTSRPSLNVRNSRHSPTVSGGGRVVPFSPTSRSRSTRAACGGDPCSQTTYATAASKSSQSAPSPLRPPWRAHSEPLPSP